MNSNDLLLRQCDALIYGYLIRRQYSSAAQYLKAESPSLRGLQPTKEGVLVLNDTVYHKNLEEIVHSFTSVGRFDVPAELIDVGAQLRNLANQVSILTSVQPQAYSTAQHMLYGRKVPSASPSASNKKQSTAGHHLAQSLASHDTNPAGMQQYLQPQHSHVQQHHPHMQQNVHHQSAVPSRVPTPHKMQANPVQQQPQQQQQQFLDVSFGGGYEQQQKGGGDAGSRQEMSKTKTGEAGKLNESNMSESGTGTSRRKATVPQSRSERIAHAAESAASIIQMEDLVSSQSVSLISNIDDGAFNNLRHLVDVNNIHECLETLDTFPFNEDLFEDTALLDDPPLASFPNDMMGRPPTAMLNEQRNVLDVPMDDNNMSRAPPPVQPSHATPLERAPPQQQQQQPRFTAMPVQRRASPVLVAPKKGSREETEKRHSNTESAFPSKSYEKRIGSPKRRNPPGQSRLEGATLVSGGGKRKEPPSINDLFGDDSYDKRDLAIEKQKNRDREQRERERRKEEMERERKRERDKDIRRRERDGESMSAIARERERRARAKEQREREQKEKEKRERAEAREASVSSSRRGSLDSTNGGGGGGRVANKEDSYRSEIEARDAHRKKMKEERDRKIEENRVKHEELSRQKREKEAEAARVREQKRKEEEAAAKEKKAKEAHEQRMEEEKRKREEDKAKEEEKKKATEKRNNLFSQSLKSKQAPMEVEMTETDKTSHLFGSLSDVFEIESDESETEMEKAVDVRKRKLNKTVPVSDKEKREREKEREKDQSKGAKKTRRPLSAASNPSSIRIALNTSSSSSLPPSTSTRKPPAKPVPKSKVAQDQLYQALFAHPVKVASAVPPKPSPKRNDSPAPLAVELGMCSGLPPKKNVPNRLVQVNTHSARLGMLLAKWKTMKTEVAEAEEKAAEEAANKKKHNESEKKKPVQESGMAALDKIMNGEEEERECVAEEERQRKALSMTPRRAARFAPIKGPPNASTDEQENNQPSRTSRRLCAGGEVVGVDMAVERDGASSEDRETADEETNQGDAEPASKKGKFTTDEINSILDTIHKK